MQYSLIQWQLFFFLYCFPGRIWGNYCFFNYFAGAGQHTYDFPCRNVVFHCFGIWYRRGYAEAVPYKILGL